MNEADYGARDRGGYWKPSARIAYPPVFVWPVQPTKFLKWLFGVPGYFLPWNLFYAGIALALWAYLTPEIETLQSFSAGWILYLLARNALLVWLFFGAWHLTLYVKKRQGTAFKFNQKWPTKQSKAFLFGSQTIDNMIWTFASAVPVWTAYEALTLWMFANGYVPWLSWSENPVYFVLLLAAVPLMRDVHFYTIHRLIHWPPLYRLAHALHHKNVNPGPWSGLSMHPIEHVFYFSGVLAHFVILSHPVHAIMHMVHAALSPAQGHAGFDRILLGEEKAYDTHSYSHYLHHRYFNCNYADGVVPLDKWFGTFHDGSEQGHQRMLNRVHNG